MGNDNFFTDEKLLIIYISCLREISGYAVAILLASLLAYTLLTESNNGSSCRQFFLATFIHPFDSKQQHAFLQQVNQTSHSQDHVKQL